MVPAPGRPSSAGPRPARRPPGASIRSPPTALSTTGRPCTIPG